MDDSAIDRNIPGPLACRRSGELFSARTATTLALGNRGHRVFCNQPVCDEHAAELVRHTRVANLEHLRRAFGIHRDDVVDLSREPELADRRRN